MKKIVIAAALSLLPSMGLALEHLNLFSARDLKVMVPIYKEMTSDIPVVRTELKSMTIDLNGDGESEVLMRDDSRCKDSSYCRIVVGRFDGDEQKWKLISDSYGYDVDFGDVTNGYRNLSISSYSRITVDHLSYQDGLYERDLSRYGDVVAFTDTADAFKGKEDYLERVLARGLGSSYSLIKQATSDGDRGLIAGGDLNYDGEPEYLFYADYAAICDASGCPLLVFSDLGKRPFAVLHAPSPNIAISREAKEGMLKSVITANGSYNWTSNGYEYKAADE